MLHVSGCAVDLQALGLWCRLPKPVCVPARRRAVAVLSLCLAPALRTLFFGP